MSWALGPANGVVKWGLSGIAQCAIYNVWIPAVTRRQGCGHDDSPRHSHGSQWEGRKERKKRAGGLCRCPVTVHGVRPTSLWEGRCGDPRATRSPALLKGTSPHTVCTAPSNTVVGQFWKLMLHTGPGGGGGGCKQQSLESKGGGGAITGGGGG